MDDDNDDDDESSNITRSRVCDVRRYLFASSYVERLMTDTGNGVTYRQTNNVVRFLSVLLTMQLKN